MFDSVCLPLHVKGLKGVFTCAFQKEAVSSNFPKTLLPAFTPFLSASLLSLLAGKLMMINAAGQMNSSLNRVNI